MNLLRQTMNENMLRMTISGKRHGELADKVKIRPVKLKEQLYFQTSVSDGKKEFHKNYEKAELLEQLDHWLRKDYRQLQMDTTTQSIQALVSKKGKTTVKQKIARDMRSARVLDHNRKKRYLLEEGTPIPFLVDLGVMTAEGAIVRSRYDKFRQINRYLEFVEDILPELDKDRELTLIDFGCGKSYLTFALYYYLTVKKQYRIRMIGLDLKKDVMEHCQELAEKYGYDRLTFLTGDIADYDGVELVDMVVSLYACDTATDYALEKALQWNAKVIFAVPCCHHELNRQMHSTEMNPVLKYGLIQERMAALMTDAFRADVLELEGYQVQVLEFIDMEHTPKNILIRAVKQNTPLPFEKKEKLLDSLQTCMGIWNVNPLFYRLRLGGEDEKDTD
ncbi:MAG: SAM-dependent methyltransferase [Lachnospiraceae bacterium]|nr:SAM-dependent methyltransferase [Lachnospiraceae bacterium]